MRQEEGERGKGRGTEADTGSKFVVVEKDNTGSLRCVPVLVCVSAHRCNSVHTNKHINKGAEKEKRK